MTVLIDRVSASRRGRAIRKRRIGPTSPRRKKPAWIRVRAPGSTPGFADDQPHRARAQARHRLRGGALPQHRRVLGEEARDLPDHGRDLHARLRLLQRAHRAARRARRRRAGARRRRGRQARPLPCRGDLGRPRRPRRRRRRAFRPRHRRDPRRFARDDDRGADARFPAQGRRARSRGRRQARRLQPQSRDRAVEISHRAAGRALLPLAAAAAAGQGARSDDVHQVGDHGRARRGARTRCCS